MDPAYLIQSLSFPNAPLLGRRGGGAYCKSMRIRVPASTANLGPGFDALALALKLYLEVEVTDADSFSISTTGEGAGLFDDERHLAARVACGVLGHTRFHLEVNSSIPLARGLGSSASLALAAASAAGSLDCLAIAVGVDGHAENAAASQVGGLVVATIIRGETVVEPLPLDREFRFVVSVPDQQLATMAAREVLPSSVAFGDATFNISRVAMLLAGLADHRRLRPDAMEDRLHQRYRSTLLPFASAMLEGFIDAGALASCWSGAGSSLLGVATTSTAEAVASAARELMTDLNVPGHVWVLEADRQGLTSV